MQPLPATLPRAAPDSPPQQARSPTATGIALAVGAATLSLRMATAAFGQVPATLSGGPPVQVVPYVTEPGVPSITITPGTANPFSGADGSGGAGSEDGSNGSTGGNVGSSDALSTMMGTLWGNTAVGNATAVGVNPSALAATCVLESGCSTPSGGSGAQGVFQMYPAAFQEGLQNALAADPSLASQIVQGSAGMNDPTTEAIAASGYLMQAAQSLQNAGISDPTVLQARGYYNFGPANGVQLATASPRHAYVHRDAQRVASDVGREWGQSRRDRWAMAGVRVCEDRDRRKSKRAHIGE